MAFVRIKKIKGNEYAYLVENTWTAKGSRQKVRQYLGRCIRPEKTAELPAPDLTSLDYKQAILALLKWQLLEHGFGEGLPGLLLRGQAVADLNKIKFFSREQPCVLALNEGFACEATIRQALDFVPSGETEEAIGAELANALLEAGLSLPPEIFVKVFEKAQHAA